MLHKIESLVSIGKFRSYQASGDVAFRKVNLFYGDNGSGKTTLTAILRSLTLNRPELLARRKSTNQTTPQSGQIISRNSAGNLLHTFNHSSGWTASYPDIEIFDIHFVNENIYSGFDFSEEHKKKLHQFVVGAQGVTIRQQIEQNKADKTASRQLQNGLEQQLVQQVGNNLNSSNVNSFLSIQLSEATGIDSKITSAEAALASANANSTIQTLQSLSQFGLVSLGLDFVSCKDDLSSTLQTIQSTTLQELFSNHCTDLQNNSVGMPENWLQTGLGYVAAKRMEDTVPVVCPFCKQQIGDLDIIQAYTLRFDTAFNSLIQRLQGYLTTLQNYGSDLRIDALENADQSNQGRITSWSPHLPSTLNAPSLGLGNDKNDLATRLRNLQQAIEQKLRNPTSAVGATDVQVVETSFSQLNSKIGGYNSQVTAYNSAIAVFRSSIQPVAQAQLDLESLKRTKKRFEHSIDSFCSQLLAEKQNLRTLEAAYQPLIQQQEAAATAFFNSYKTRVNHYLGTVFKTLFRIDNVVNVPPQGLATQSKIGYKLTIDGNDISFDTNQPNNAKDCLSEGDKSTIALAFFLSKLDIDQGLGNKVLVFDDPLSSFDSNRRTYTVQLIKDLVPRIDQAIVLSHNEFFLSALAKGVAPGDRKELRITENFTTKASTIEELDLSSLVQNDYFKHIVELEKFLQSPDVSKKEIVLGWLRNVLEAHLRFKFYRQLSSLPQNQQTLGRIIDSLITQGVTFRDDANRASIISKLKLLNGVSCRPHHGEPMPDFSTWTLNPASITATELAALITDALNLVDREL